MSFQKAIANLKMASGILLGTSKPKQYPKSSYREIRPSASVREAWEGVGECFRAVLEEVESEE